MLKKGTLLAVAFGILAVLGTSSVASAGDWYRDCDRRIAHEQHELDRAIAHYGYYSHQAEHERHELDRIRAECRNYR